MFETRPHRIRDLTYVEPANQGVYNFPAIRQYRRGPYAPLRVLLPGLQENLFEDFGYY
jgi:hypothetical protein